MKKLLLAFLCICGLLSTQAQEATNTTGGEAIGDGGSSSYTVGQVFYQTHAGTGSVAQGVQHPYEISVVTGIEEAKTINLIVKAYPNPAVNYLILEVKDTKDLNLNFCLYDVQGKLLEKATITGIEIEISMINYMSGNYFVKVFSENKELKTFKIAKK
jgi:hypothetical protein